MTLANPYELLQVVCDRELGFQPVNFSIKPVHVANGLARALTGRTYQTDALARTLRRYVVKQTLQVEQERHPNAEILEMYADAFEPLRGSAPDLQRLSRLRALALDVLGADGGVYDVKDPSSYTLSNERFLTTDPSDRGSGRFLARLLQTEHGGAADAKDLLVALLSSEGDAWTTLALPLFQFGSVRAATGGAPGSEAPSDALLAVSDGHLQSRTLGILRNAYDRLARFEREGGSKLNSLRRLVLFGCFALHVHAISRWNERNPARPQPPILLDMFDGTVASVRDASRATLRAAGDAIEFLILDAFKEHVESIGTTFEDLMAALDDVAAELQAGTDRKAEKAREAHEALVKDFHTFAAAEREPVDALARALVDAAFEAAREHPIGCLIELGRRGGFLSPWANNGRGGKLQKRYTATAEFLEILVAATVEPEQPLDFPEFLDKLRENFGILAGRAEDDPIIRRNNRLPEPFGPPTSINEVDLRRNVEELRRLLIETGYGKSYADGTTVITTEPEVLV